jgi:hypothetical protein
MGEKRLWVSDIGQFVAQLVARNLCIDQKNSLRQQRFGPISVMFAASDPGMVCLFSLV